MVDLPKVLIIGDSISIGYTEPVRDALQGVCDVYRADDNCADTNYGLSRIHTWLGAQTWDLIHFNWGLHDLCYRHPDAQVYGNRDKINGTISVEPEAYRANLDQLVDLLTASAKRLIWASTTYVPDGEAGRHQGDDVRYNAIAAEVMQERNIWINDLHALTRLFSPSLFTCPGDVHYTGEGYGLIAEAVSSAIRTELTRPLQHECGHCK